MADLEPYAKKSTLIPAEKGIHDVQGVPIGAAAAGVDDDGKAAGGTATGEKKIQIWHRHGKNRRWQVQAIGNSPNSKLAANG